ncbi:MAG: LacI family DNA-binding transcriptional regulator [Nostocoides sp.]|uniref:LacI family DNA-binding transcriptional regulator n=1 Tax=Nostocoides sp. TaxID=1917966 RepID=UPI002CC97884|nr:LacI family DNA-binding transcriptional regulator [Tetrasphaera sp.]
MTTIADVARAAGVSVATVSRTLHGSLKVDPRTRERVLAVAAELEYVASPTATSLASGRTNVVAVVAPMMSRWFFASIVTTIEFALREAGYHVLLMVLDEPPEEGRSRLTPEMFAKRVDGIIWLNVAVSSPELALLRRLSLPMVCVGTPIDQAPTVMIDDHEAARAAVQHVLDLGHTEIAYVGTAVRSIAHMSTPAARVAAYRQALTEAGITPRDGWVIASDWTADAAGADVEPVLRGTPRPTAVVAASDEMAIGVMGTARRLGLRVPDDLSVIGIDDHTFAHAMGLSTVRQDVPAQGRAAVELLLAGMRERCDAPAVRLEMRTALIARDTTAPPARS